MTPETRESRADNSIQLPIEGPGEIVATDNGDPTSFELFSSHDRKAFNGLALAIVLGKRGEAGAIRLTASSEGLGAARVAIRSLP